jgi:D-arabinose 1-dehydrogenase-like Zn-dependent alcohol dehydrogenase
MGRRVIAIDGGEEKRQLCKSLGADVWIDYTKSKDIVSDIKQATDGLGAHAAVVTTASVRPLMSFLYICISAHRYSIPVVWLYTSHRLPPQ